MQYLPVFHDKLKMANGTISHHNAKKKKNAWWSKSTTQFSTSQISAKWLHEKLGSKFGPITAPAFQIFPSMMILLFHVEVTRPKTPIGEC